MGLAFSVGGNGITSPAVYIKQNGDVGIGTAGPAAGYKLDAAGAGGTGIRITDISNTSSLRFQWADSTGTITAAKDGAIATAINFNTQTAAGATTGTLSLNAGNVGIGTTNPVANLDVSGTGSIKIPVGSTAERPSAPANGMMRMNTTTGKLEYYYNLGWNSIGAVAATGGTINDGVTGYRIHTFTASEAITFTTGGTVEVLVVAGGGGGRGDRGAGGGAGGLIYQSAFTVAPQTYSVTVGAGGAGGVGVNAYPGVNGGNSIFSTLTAVGGGYGGRYGENNGASGGSGGGGAGLGTSGQGRDGGSGNGSAPGGGGGAGGAGQSAPNTTTGGNGGVGLAYSISGSSVYYSGGGGAGRGMDTGTSRGLGGLGGGGDGGNAGGAAGAAGAANTGGGGGGGANIPQGDGGIGGSGIVIIRYPN